MTKYNFVKFEGKGRFAIRSGIDLRVTDRVCKFYVLPKPFVGVYVDEMKKTVAFQFYDEQPGGAYRPYRTNSVKDTWSLVSERVNNLMKETLGVGDFVLKQEDGYFIPVRMKDDVLKIEG